MDHSNLYEEESDPDDYDKLEAEFGARNLLGAVKDALESEERNGEDEDAGVGKFGEASLATNAESNKAGSDAPEIGIAGAGLGSERWKEGSSKKEGKNTRKHKKKKKAEKEVAFNMAAIMAATTVSKGEDPMHLQDPLRGDYLEQTDHHKTGLTLLERYVRVFQHFNDAPHLGQLHAMDLMVDQFSLVLRAKKCLSAKEHKIFLAEIILLGWEKRHEEEIFQAICHAMKLLPNKQAFFPLTEEERIEGQNVGSWTHMQPLQEVSDIGFKDSIVFDLSTACNMEPRLALFSQRATGFFSYKAWGHNMEQNAVWRYRPDATIESQKPHRYTKLGKEVREKDLLVQILHRAWERRKEMKIKDEKKDKRLEELKQELGLLKDEWIGENSGRNWREYEEKKMQAENRKQPMVKRPLPRRPDGPVPEWAKLVMDAARAPVRPLAKPPRKTDHIPTVPTSSAPAPTLTNRKYVEVGGDQVIAKLSEDTRAELYAKFGHSPPIMLAIVQKAMTDPRLVKERPGGPKVVSHIPKSYVTQGRKLYDEDPVAFIAVLLKNQIELKVDTIELVAEFCEVKRARALLRGEEPKSDAVQPAEPEEVGRTAHCRETLVKPTSATTAGENGSTPVVDDNQTDPAAAQTPSDSFASSPLRGRFSTLCLSTQSFEDEETDSEVEGVENIDALPVDLPEKTNLEWLADGGISNTSWLTADRARSRSYSSGAFPTNYHMFDQSGSGTIFLRTGHPPAGVAGRAPQILSGPGAAASINAADPLQNSILNSGAPVFGPPTPGIIILQHDASCKPGEYRTGNNMQTKISSLPLPVLPTDWTAENNVKVVGQLTQGTERSVEPVGPSFLRHAQRIRHKRTFSEDDRIQALKNVKKVEDEDAGEISEDEDPQMLLRDAKDWKQQDHYAVLGLSKYRYKATEEQIKRAHRKKVLRHHPDKKAAAGSTEDDSFFKCIQKATEVLTDPVKRRQFDSVDPAADVEPPTKKQVQKGNFYKLYSPVFKAEGRFSKTQPVPKLGDENSTKEEVEHFYNFWYNFDSWRSFEYQDEDVPDDNENRDQKRHMERKNNNARKKKKVEDNQRLRKLVDDACALDERIKKFRQAASAEKNKKKNEREAAEKKAAEEAAAAAAKAAADAKAAEEAAKADREGAKKAKEAAKNAVKKNKRVLKGSVKDAKYFGDDSAAGIDNTLNDVDLVVSKIDADEIAALAGKLTGLKVADEIKGVWSAEVKRLVDAGKVKEGEIKTLA